MDCRVHGVAELNTTERLLLCSKVEGRLKDSAPPSPRAKRCCSRTQLLHGLREFAFITQLQLGNGQDRLNSLQFSVYVMNELRGEALFYQGQVLGHFLRQEEDDTCAPGQGQLGDLKQQGGGTWVSRLVQMGLTLEFDLSWKEIAAEEPDGPACRGRRFCGVFQGPRGADVPTVWCGCWGG